MNAAQYRKELVENIEHNALGPNDTFQFTCKECGECCRKRATPVMLTGLDIYRMAKGLWDGLLLLRLWRLPFWRASAGGIAGLWCRGGAKALSMWLLQLLFLQMWFAGP